MATRLPANKLFGFAIAASSILNLLIPLLAINRLIIMIGIRVLHGLLEGMMFPSVFAIMRHWVPPMERTRLLTIVIAASYAGFLVGRPLSRLLTEYLDQKSLFYVYGELIIYF